MRENRQLMLKNDQRKRWLRVPDDSSNATRGSTLVSVLRSEPLRMKLRTRPQATAMLAMNDPRGGGGPDGPGPRGPQGGPPDLDELWRDFNPRLSRLFNRKSGGNGAPQRPGHARRNLSLIALGVLIAAWIGNGVFVVPEGQTGVVLRLGEFRHTVPAGVQWRLPFPIESDEIVNVTQVRSVDIGRLNVVPATNMK